MAVTIPSTSLLLLAWTAGGILAITGGLTYAEMGAMFPRSGGVYVFLKEAYGPLPAFLYGWVALLVVFSGGLAAVSVGFAEYLSYFVPRALASIVLFDVDAGFGTADDFAGSVGRRCGHCRDRRDQLRGRSPRQSRDRRIDRRQGWALAALPIMAIVAARDPNVDALSFPPGLASPASAFGVAMIAVLWTYEAWYFVTFAAGEIKDPRRNVPRALVGGLLAADDDLSHRQPCLLLRADTRRTARRDPGRRTRRDGNGRSGRRHVRRPDGRCFDLRQQRRGDARRVAAACSPWLPTACSSRPAAACTRATARRTWRSWR